MSDHISDATRRFVQESPSSAVNLLTGLVRRAFEGETADQLSETTIADAHTVADHYSLSAEDPDRADLVDFARDAARLAVEPRIQDLFRAAL